MADWQPIETAPNHTHSERVLIIGGAWPKPELVLPDGDWWRMRTKEGSVGAPTHWMPLPEAPTILDKGRSL